MLTPSVRGADCDAGFADAYERAAADLSSFADLLTSLHYPIHNSYGLFHLALCGEASIAEQAIDKWVSDEEHGLLHGVMTGFWACRRLGFRHTPDSERLLGSCILHDFVRVERPYEVESHDADLGQVFPDLDPAAYQHRNPPPAFHSHGLVVGDRVELLRFEDAAEWVEPELLPPEARSDYAAFFYRHIRPAIAACFRDQGSAWLRHFPESDRMISHAIADRGNYSDALPDTGKRCERDPSLYPSVYWACDGDRWAAEVGGLIASDLPINRIWFRHSDHRELPYGMISIERLLQSDACCSAVPARDHLAVRACVPLSQWLFLLNGPPEPWLPLLRKSLGFAPERPVRAILEMAAQLKRTLHCLRARPVPAGSWRASAAKRPRNSRTLQ